METTKICTKCNKEKPISEFNNGKIYHDGKTPSCKLCIKEAKQLYYLKNKNKVLDNVKKYAIYNSVKLNEYRKLYYEQNKDNIKINQKEYRNNNIEQINLTTQKWRKNNPDKIKLSEKKWYENNKDKINIIKKRYIINRKNNDPLFKLTENVRVMIGNSFRRQGYKKTSRTHEILGCSYADFKEYLETKFEVWMSWENKGKYNGELNHGWDIDHVIPLATARTEEELLKLNHFSNLQPLCSKINRDIKKKKLNY